MDASGSSNAQVAIVTGAGRGLGRALSVGLAEAGFDVALASRSRDELDQTAAQVRALGRKALVVPTDVTRRADVDWLVETTVAELGGLDLLINNSGTYQLQTLLDTTDEDWDRVVDTNLKGCMYCTRAAGRVLVGQGRGKVVNIASNLGIVGRAGFSSYCASKAAVIGFTKAMALEWATSGVQVNAIAPGYFETEFNAELREDESAAAKVIKRIPAGRMARPDELISLVLYLASPASNFMIGETIVIDGGESVR
jgi:2-deoxy-D-gluconate 3-dehydrogenase